MSVFAEEPFEAAEQDQVFEVGRTSLHDPTVVELFDTGVTAGASMILLGSP